MMPSFKPRQQQILQSVLQEFESSCAKNSFLVVGIVLGGLASRYELGLGSRFGADFSDYIGVNDSKAKDFISVIIGIIDALTAMSLLSLPTRDYLLEKFSKSNDGLYQPPNPHAHLRSFTYAISYIPSLLSALPFMYEIKVLDEGNLAKQVIFALAAFMVSVPACTLGQRPYIDWIYNRYNLEDAETKHQRQVLANKGEQAFSALLALPEARLDMLTNYIQENSRHAFFDLGFVLLLNKLCRIETNIVDCSPALYSLKNFILDFICLALGTLTNYGLFFLAISGLEWFEQNVAGFDVTTGLMTMNILLAALGTYSNCLFITTVIDKWADDLMHKLANRHYRITPQTSHPALRLSINILSYFTGAISAAYNVSLGIQSYQAGQTPIELIPFAGLGVFVALTKSVDLLGQEIISSFDLAFLSKAPAVRRDFVRELVWKYKTRILDSVPPDKINDLYQMTCATELRTKCVDKVVANDRHEPSFVGMNEVRMEISSSNIVTAAAKKDSTDLVINLSKVHQDTLSSSSQTFFKIKPVANLDSMNEKTKLGSRYGIS